MAQFSHSLFVLSKLKLLEPFLQEGQNSTFKGGWGQVVVVAFRGLDYSSFKLISARLSKLLELEFGHINDNIR